MRRGWLLFAGLSAMLVAACGSPADGPPAAASIEAAGPATTSALDPFEVSVTDYAACVTKGACPAPLDEWDLCNFDDPKGHARHPINCVSWREADAYCRFAGRRLPTEAEWRSALLDDPRLQQALKADDLEGKICWDRDSGEPGTCEVGSHPTTATAAGIHDLAGNVWEWTATAAESRAGGSTPDYVILGGGWEHDPLSPTPEIGLDARDQRDTDHRATDLGFRCHAK